MDALVSVIIPTCRRTAAMLCRAVESVQAQSYGNLEILIIDDSAADGENRRAVDAYLARAAADDPKRVFAYRNGENLGPAQSRNRGVALAHGAFITFLDDDDVYLPNKIERQLEFMQQTGCDLSFSNMEMRNDAGALVEERAYRDMPAWDTADGDALLSYHLRRHMTGTPTFMFRAEALRALGGFPDVRIGEEFLLMLGAIESGLRIGYLDACDVRVYKHGGESLDRGQVKLDGENALYAIKKRYFPRLSRSERRFICFRHRAVLGVAYARDRAYLSALGCLTAAFFTAPCAFVREAAMQLSTRARGRGPKK